MASILSAGIFRKRYSPRTSIVEAWTKLLLAQHHDCWIVPYNLLPSRRTWAEEVTAWTGLTNNISDSIIEQSMRTLTVANETGVISSGETGITVFNTLTFPRIEQIAVKIPDSWNNRKLHMVMYYN